MTKDQAKVLIVDDDELIREALQVYLEAHDYLTEQVDSGEAAIAIFEDKKLDHGFDLILLDFVMPGIDGLMTFQKIHSIDNCLPALMLTGFPTIKLATRFIQMGGTDFLVKPFDPQSEVLGITIREALDYARIKRAQAADTNVVPDEPMVFLDEHGAEKQHYISCNPGVWNVLIASANEAIHAETKLALEMYMFHGFSLNFFSVYSVTEAESWLAKNPGMAMVISDVVMETEFAGFDIVRYIRGTMGNRLIRIILRAEHHGDFPEQKVILDHEIDGFLTKRDTSIQRFIIMVTTTLRAYRDILYIEKQRQYLAWQTEHTGTSISLEKEAGT